MALGVSVLITMMWLCNSDMLDHFVSGKTLIPGRNKSDLQYMYECKIIIPVEPSSGIGVFFCAVYIVNCSYCSSDIVLKG